MSRPPLSFLKIGPVGELSLTLTFLRLFA